MAKNIIGTKLPRKLEQEIQIVGEQIKLVRLRRNLSVAQIAEHATFSPLTVATKTSLSSIAAVPLRKANLWIITFG